jgi:DNA-binding transcriptional MerR regulator
VSEGATEQRSAEDRGSDRGRRGKRERGERGATRARIRRFYRSRDAAEIVGVSRRRLQYWAQTDLVRPVGGRPGSHHRYSFEDLVALKATKRLIDAGVSVQRIRKSMRALRRLLPTVGRPLSELVLVATGDVVLVLRDGAAFEAVSGQEWVFPVAEFVRELAAWAGDGARAEEAGAGGS